MYRSISYIVFISVIFIGGCEPQTVGEMPLPDGAVQYAVRSNDIQWKPCPASLPPGCEIAALEGNPKKPALFTVRLRLSSQFNMPAHTHPKYERVTILDGRISVSFDTSGKHVNPLHFESGDYYINKSGVVHTVKSDTDSIIQITGIGPWETHFVEK